jgi:hypothetical protein
MMTSILAQSPSSDGRPDDLTDGYDAARTSEPTEGGALMNTKQKWGAKAYPRSEGNLALADETFSPVLRPAPAITGKNLNDDTLAPAIGILSAFGLSVILWGLIILGVSWVW